MTEYVAHEGTLRRYAQLGILILAGGCIYPLVYLRANYEISILESFNITVGELGECMALLGLMFTVTYLPSGWLADKVSPRWLISLSLAGTAILGFWFSTFPPLEHLYLIYLGWGITTGLTFWSSMIKAVAILAKPEEQGRFFGINDGGRGLFEAALATAAVAWFAYSIETLDQSISASLQQVIYIYVATLLCMSPIVALTLDDIRSEPAPAGIRLNFWRDVIDVVAKKEIWLCAVCILCGYQLVSASAAFSAYFQQNFGMTAVTVGFITVAQMWMRPIGAITAGIAGDLTQRESTLAGLFIASSLVLASIVLVSKSTGSGTLLAIVLAIAVVTSAVRGIYWGSLESCSVSPRVKGLAIGIISLVGYSPDVYLPLIYGRLIEHFPGTLGYEIYFCGIALMGLLGAASAWRLKVLCARRG